MAYFFNSCLQTEDQFDEYCIDIQYNLLFFMCILDSTLPAENQPLIPHIIARLANDYYLQTGVYNK